MTRHSHALKLLAIYLPQLGQCHVDVGAKLHPAIWPLDRQSVNMEASIMHILWRGEPVEAVGAIEVGLEVQDKHVHAGNPAFSSTAAALPATARLGRAEDAGRWPAGVDSGAGSEPAIGGRSSLRSS